VTNPAEAPASAPVKTLAPLARQVVKAVAVEHGVCVRPVPMRRVNLATGEAERFDVPCGHTLASVCPSCAERKRKLRAVQCAQGWHLAEEPVIERADPDAEQRHLMQLRAQAQARRDAVEAGGPDAHGDLAWWDGLILELDREIERTGVAGRLRTGDQRSRRTRSTRRRQDVPDLPRRPVDNRTVGRTFSAGAARPSGPRSSSPSPSTATARSRRTAPRSIRPRMTIGVRRGTLCTSPS